MMDTCHLWRPDPWKVLLPQEGASRNHGLGDNDVGPSVAASAPLWWGGVRSGEGHTCAGSAGM